MSVWNLSQMAWKNLWRNTRRTAITLFGIAFGVLLAVVFTGMGDAAYGEWIDLAARMGAGHVTVEHPEYRDRPTISRSISDTPALAEEAMGISGVEKAVPRVSGQTMLATARTSTGAAFIAYDPAVEDEKSLSVLDALVEGAPFKKADDKGIILGEVLAENLGARMGGKVVYTLTDSQGEIVSGLGRVSGIVRTGAPSVDGALALLPLGTMQELLGYERDEATGLAVFIDDQRRSAQVAEALRLKVDDSVAVLTWSEVQPDLAGFIAMKVNSTFVLEGIILLLIAAGIFNTLLVSVMERTRELGVMIAVGFSPFRVFAMVVFESLWLALLGLLTGAAVTAGPYYYLHERGIDFSAALGEGQAEVAGVAVDSLVKVAIYPESLLAIVGFVVLATMLSGLYPALRAGRVEPVEAIRLV